MEKGKKTIIQREEILEDDDDRNIRFFVDWETLKYWFSWCRGKSYAP